MYIISLILYAVSLIICWENDKKKRDLELAQAEVKILKGKLRLLECELRCHKSLGNHYNTSNSNVVSNDIKEAVKFAMKKSHPDNGGSAEEFDKFRKLYERMK